MKIISTYRLKNIILISFFFITLFILLFFSSSNFESVKTSTILFIYNVLPSLFPFIFFTEIVLKTNIINILSKYLGKIFSKLFKISEESTPAIIIGFLCGYPMGSKTVATIYEKNKISKKEATTLLNFVNNCNPVFILSTVGISIFKNINIGIILIISHYLSAILIATFTTRFNYKSNIIIHKKINNLNINIKNTEKSVKDFSSFFDIIKMSLKNTFFTLANIFGFIIIFNLISNVIKTVILKLNISTAIISTISGIFEVTNGINEICNTPITLYSKICIVSFLLGFSGICILTQVYSTISKHSFSFTRILLFKFLQGVISFFITYLILLFLGSNHISDIYVFNNLNENITYSDFLNNISNYYLNSMLIIIAFTIIIYILFFLYNRLKVKKYNKNKSSI